MNATSCISLLSFHYSLHKLSSILEAYAELRRRGQEVL